MNLINCKKCGILFSKKLRDTCDKCTDIENKEIASIIDFVKKSSNALIAINDISQTLDISLKEITALYKSGRLSVIKNRLTIKCTICKTQTKTTEIYGHFCSKCSQEMLGDRQKIEINNKEKHSKIKSAVKPTVKFGFKKSYEE